MEQKPICFKSGERFLGRNSQILHHSPKVPELYTKEVNLIKNIKIKICVAFCHAYYKTQLKQQTAVFNKLPIS